MNKAVEALIKNLAGRAPKVAIVLGSGLGALVDAITDPVRVAFDQLPGFPQSGVSGHAGELVAGNLSGKPVIALSGRVHYYEQGQADAMRMPLEVLKAVGIEQVLLTNSAGSLNNDMPPGSVMLIDDHINWSGMNPLIGEASDARFVGMTTAYDEKITTALATAADRLDIALHKGVYMWFSGPSFETPAEIRMARNLGADAVGMSTVPEVILARFLGLDTAAISVITNFGAGMTGGELSHGETKEFAPMGGEKLVKILSAYFESEAKP